MKDDTFREYAQHRVKSEVDTVLSYLVGKAKPAYLEEDGRIPNKYLVPMNNPGECSLYFHNGKFNINRRGMIKRLRPGDVDSALRQLDDKTIHNYLSIAKIAMVKCENDSIMLRPHVDLNGGAWQVGAFGFIMWSMQAISRTLWTMTLARGVRDGAQLLQDGGQRLAQETARIVQPQLTDAERKIVLGLQGSVNQALGVAMYVGSVASQSLVENVRGFAQNGVQVLSESTIRGVRNLEQPAVDEALAQVFGWDTPAVQATEGVVSSARETLSPATSGPHWYKNAAGDVIAATFPERAQEATTAVAATASSWAWMFNLLEVSFPFRFG